MSRGTTWIVTALGAVVMAVLMVVLVLRVAGDPQVKSQLVRDTFSVGDARRLAPRVDRDGPLLLQDPGGNGANVAMVHTGRDPLKGWLAVDLRSPGRVGCTLRLDRVKLALVDRCTGRTFAPSDPGLRRYPARVVEGQVVVDVRAGPSPSGRR